MDRHLFQLPIGLLTLAALATAAGAQCPEQSFQGLDTGNTDAFGYSIAATTPRLIVGAPNDDDQGAAAGSAYIFQVGPSGFVQEAKLLGSAVTTNDRFGWSVGMTDLGVLIGAPYGTGHASGSGVVYGFKRQGNSWTETALLYPNEGALLDGFGWSLAVDGNRAVVGAPFAETTPGGDDGGAVYIFEFGGGNGWQFVQKLVPNDIHSEVRYGSTVALDGDRIVVGAPHDDDGGLYSGAAYVFDELGGSWYLSIKLIPLDFEPGAQFGTAVAVDGDEVMVGAPVATGNGVRSGVAYVFSDGSGSWSQDAKLFDPAGAFGDRFGHSVSLQGGRAVVGAPWSEEAGQTVGQAYECERSAGAWSVLYSVKSPSSSTQDLSFGSAVVVEGGLSAVGDHADGENLVHAFIPGGPDCNLNGIPDRCDIAAGTSTDANGNGIPDECEGCGKDNYCTSGPNSTGSPAVMGASGSVSVVANDLVLQASPVPNQPGIFFYGSVTASVPFGNGVRCVGAPIQRLPVQFGSGNAITMALDNTSPPTPSGQITPGSTWYFQCWFRDPAGGGDDFDLSDGLKVVFCP